LDTTSSILGSQVSKRSANGQFTGTEGTKIREHFFRKKGMNDSGKQKWLCLTCKGITVDPEAHKCK
jgi:hypothetical protein